MKKTLLILLLSFTFISCGILFPFPESKKYPTTTFYVKNNSDRTINFKTSVIKQSTITGPFEMTVPFTVQPKDSVLARQIGFEKDSQNPQKWFSKFEIFPIDGVKMFDPNKAENWRKGVNNKGKPIYTFTIAE